MSCWHVYWEAFINSDSTHPVKQASYIRLMLNECFHQSSLGNLWYCYRWNGCNLHLSSRCHAGKDLHGSRHGNYFNQRITFETNSTKQTNLSKCGQILLLSRSLSGNKLHMLSKSESVFFTTVLVQIASALIILQMLTFQSDSLVSMKEMGRYSWFQHCTSVGHCAVPCSTALVWPLGICLE